jgi:hypothetical protein
MIEIRHGAMGFIQNGIGSDAGGKCALMVGIAIKQIAVDTLKGLPGNLGSTWVVEKTAGRLRAGNWVRMVGRSRVILRSPENKLVKGKFNYSPYPVLIYSIDIFYEINTAWENDLMPLPTFFDPHE